MNELDYDPDSPDAMPTQGARPLGAAKERRRTAADILDEGATTYRERNAIYGDNYRSFGAVMAALFPDGYAPETEEDWNRLGLFVQCVSKLSRYAINMRSGGHLDSAHDLCVYAAMLQELTSPAKPE